MKTKIKTDRRRAAPAATELSLARSEVHNAEVVEDAPPLLSDAQRKERDRLIGIVQRVEKEVTEAQHVLLFNAAGALRKLHEEKLYLETHASFDEFVRDTFKRTGRWGRLVLLWDRANSTAQGLLSAGTEAPGNQPDSKRGPGAPFSLKLVRLVEGLTKEQQDKVFNSVLKLTGGGKPSRKQVAAAAAPFKKPKKPRKPKVETEDEEPAPAKPGPKASHPDKAAAERLTEIAKELEKIPRGGLNNDARREKLEEERAALEAGLQGKAAEKERAKTNGNGSAKKSVLLTAHEVKARIAAWLKSELTTEQRNKSQPVWKTAERIKDLF